jgi:hypothetical protein
MEEFVQRMKVIAAESERFGEELRQDSHQKRTHMVAMEQQVVTQQPLSLTS